MTPVALVMPMLLQDSAPPPQGPPPTGTAMLWAGVLMGAALVGGLVWLWLRRRLLAPESGSPAGTIMEDLRRMRDEGQISQEEYDSIRKNMAQRLAKSGFGEEKPAPRSNRHGR